MLELKGVCKMDDLVNHYAVEYVYKNGYDKVSEISKFFWHGIRFNDGFRKQTSLSIIEESEDLNKNLIRQYLKDDVHSNYESWCKVRKEYYSLFSEKMVKRLIELSKTFSVGG